MTRYLYSHRSLSYRIIKKLISNAIRTGAVTSLVATGGLIAYLRDERSNSELPTDITLLFLFILNSFPLVSVAFGFCVSRVYSLTLLYNINNRGGLPQSQMHSPDRLDSQHPALDSGAREAINMDTNRNEVVITTVQRLSFSMDDQNYECDGVGGISTRSNDLRGGSGLLVSGERGRGDVRVGKSKSI